MKIDFENDIEYILKKLKTSRFFYILLIALLLIENLIFILCSTYFNKNIFMLICCILNVIFIALIIYVVFFLTLRYKRIYYFIGMTSTFEIVCFKGVVIEITKPYTYQKDIIVSDIVFEGKDASKNRYVFPIDLYNFSFQLNTSYSIKVRNNVIVEVSKND